MNMQFKMYSIDTKSFFTKKESKLNMAINSLNKIKYSIMDYTLYQIVNKNKELKYKCWQEIRDLKFHQKKAFNQFVKKNKHLRQSEDYKTKLKQSELYNVIDKKIEKAEKDLVTLVNSTQNNNRQITKKLTDHNTIAVFEGSLSRILDLGNNQLTDKIIVVKIHKDHQNSIMKSIIDNGFTLGQERYITLTASAGQIRKHKILFIKNTIWEQFKGKVQCGLDIKDMNESEYQGCNINKMLSYLALQLSATDVWEGFDIERCIVCNDLETEVNGTVDYISRDLDISYNENKDILINQIDGCGMIDPELSDKNFMVRLPWMKGLLAVFDTKNWCKTINKGYYKVIDIYNKEYDILDDNIQIIFSKSQFKMWKYYKVLADKYNTKNGTTLTGWDMYKKLFKQYQCEASKCNIEEDIKTKIIDNKTKYYYKKASYNYQMFQTLTDITDAELKAITKSTVDLVTNAHTKIDSMLNILGYDENSNLALCVEKYPSIMLDSWVKDRLEDKLTSIKKSAKAAKIKIDATYAFVIPDLFAYCEFLFKGDKDPKGILEAKEVHCRMFPQKEILFDRSPSLYKEHWVTMNKKRQEHTEWFTTNAIYVNIHDLASKVLMYDFDGDKLLIVNGILVNIAKRNMEGINPLFYNMGVAGCQIINNENIYKSLTYAYKVGNVGKYSNKITQIWNMYPGANETEKKVLLDKARILTALNNFSIDSAKSLDFVKISKSKRAFLKSEKDMPYFFQFAKDYNSGKCLSIGNGTVDRIAKIIEDIPYTEFNFDNIPRFNYRKLMQNSKVDIDSKIVKIYEKYVELQQQAYIYNNSNSFEELDEREVARLTNQSLLIDFAKEVTGLNMNVYNAVDIIIKYVFKNKPDNGKSFLFDVLGGYIYDNLCVNIKSTLVDNIRKSDNLTSCVCCGEGFLKTNNRQIMCLKCAKLKIKERDRNRKKKIS